MNADGHGWEEKRKRVLTRRRGDAEEDGYELGRQEMRKAMGIEDATIRSRLLILDVHRAIDV